MRLRLLTSDSSRARGAHRHAESVAGVLWGPKPLVVDLRSSSRPRMRQMAERVRGLPVCRRTGGSRRPQENRRDERQTGSQGFVGLRVWRHRGVFVVPMRSAQSSPATAHRCSGASPSGLWILVEVDQGVRPPRLPNDSACRSSRRRRESSWCREAWIIRLGLIDLAAAAMRSEPTRTRTRRWGALEELAVRNRWPRSPRSRRRIDAELDELSCHRRDMRARIAEPASGDMCRDEDVDPVRSKASRTTSSIRSRMRARARCR